MAKDNEEVSEEEEQNEEIITTDSDLIPTVEDTYFNNTLAQIEADEKLENSPNTCYDWVYNRVNRYPPTIGYPLLRYSLLAKVPVSCPHLQSLTLISFICPNRGWLIPRITQESTKRHWICQCKSILIPSIIGQFKTTLTTLILVNICISKSMLETIMTLTKLYKLHLMHVMWMQKHHTSNHISRSETTALFSTHLPAFTQLTSLRLPCYYLSPQFVSQWKPACELIELQLDIRMATHPVWIRLSFLFCFLVWLNIFQILLLMCLCPSWVMKLIRI